MPAYEIAIRDFDLPRDAHRVDLVGSPRKIVWPNLCPNCGAMVSERISIAKIFRPVTGDATNAEAGQRRDVITRLKVPFCAACGARHRQLVQPPGQFDGWLAVFASPVVLALIGSTAMAMIVFRPLVLDHLDDPSRLAIGLAVTGVFVLIAVATVVTAWWGARYFRVPRQTEITRAFDFSDNLGNVLRGIGERRAYAIRNEAFAKAFVEANRERLMTDEVRQRDDHRSRIAFAVLAVLLALAWWLLPDH